MIHVIDDYVIECDGVQYIVGKLGKVKRKGESVVLLRAPTYYSSLAGALTAISKRLRMDKLKHFEGSFAEAYAAMKQADERMIAAISKFDEVVAVSAPNETRVVSE